MRYLAFTEHVARRDEGLWLPNKPIVAGMGKINPFPVTQARLDRIVTKAGKPPAQVKPAVPTVPKSIPKLVPSPLSTRLASINRVFEAGMALDTSHAASMNYHRPVQNLADNPAR
jgi:hypothetical protein